MVYNSWDLNVKASITLIGMRVGASNLLSSIVLKEKKEKVGDQKRIKKKLILRNQSLFVEFEFEKEKESLLEGTNSVI